MRVEDCMFSDMGVYVKQAGAVYMALSANSTIRRNIAFNLPRAAVNYNDGAFGGHLLERNLFFNAVSQCVGHGALWLARKTISASCFCFRCERLKTTVRACLFSLQHGLNRA